MSKRAIASTGVISWRDLMMKKYVRLNLGISIVMSHCLTDQDQLYRKSVRRYFPERRYGIVLRKGRELTLIS